MYRVTTEKLLSFHIMLYHFFRYVANHSLCGHSGRRFVFSDTARMQAGNDSDEARQNEELLPKRVYFRRMDVVWV